MVGTVGNIKNDIFTGYYSQFWAVIISPLFFGVAHFHHMVERIRKGEVKSGNSYPLLTSVMFRPGRSHVLPGLDVSVRLHDNIRDVFSSALHQNWTLRCPICCSRLLQLHGFPGLHGGCQFRAKEEDSVDDSLRSRRRSVLPPARPPHQ